MRDHDNMQKLLEMAPDFMGLIFYPPSKRYVSDLSVESMALLRGTQTKVVGVFVDESVDTIFEKAETYSLDYIQLHGDEGPTVGKQLKARGLSIIKVFRIAESLPFEEMRQWEHLADYFLFDTSTSQYGGSGKQFDWTLLEAYQSATPYLLSGGIGPTDIEAICQLKMPGLAGIDVNSRFEVAPGLKDIEKIREMKEVLC